MVAIGITSFISSVLARGAKFSPSVSTRHSAELGLSIGRTTDHLVRRVIAGSATLNPRMKKHSRAIEIFRLLNQLGLKRLVAQVPVKDTALGIRTTIDLTAHNKAGNLVVIEIKTSQDKISQHRERYHKRCRNCPTLQNGLPNNEFWRHQLQCGFGMLLKNTVEGIVVVACDDGIAHYPVSLTARERRMFQISTPGATHIQRPFVPRTIPWPVDADHELRDAFKQKGYSDLVSTDPIVVLKGRHGFVTAIIIHNHDKYKGSQLEKDHRKFVQKNAKTVFSTKGNCLDVVFPVIVFLNKGKWVIKAAGPKLKPVQYK